MGRRYSGRRPEDQPMYTKPSQLDFEKRRLFITSISPIIKSLFDFLGLSDTPSSYSGQANKTVKVNSGETALMFGMVEDDVLGSLILDGGNADIDISDSIVMVVDLGGA